MKKLLYMGIGAILALYSCKNQDWEFPDYEYQTVYFPYQFPIRTITFGDDIFDTSLDNQGKLKIMATLGGAYTSPDDVSIGIQVDNNLCTNLVYESTRGGHNVVPMPSNYYTLASDKIIIPKGQIQGGVEVQLTDAYFADPNAKNVNYVIPVRMTHVVNADSILSGVPLAGLSNPNPAIVEHWESNMSPKNFTLYAVNYINEWHGHYLRRGKDDITGKNGHSELTRAVVRRNADMEKDQVISLLTEARRQIILPLVYPGVGGVNVNADLLLTFDNENNCTITASGNGYTASGSGKFVSKGEKNSFGNQDRDALYLEYDIELNDMHVSTKDTLVMRNRGTVLNLFTPELNN